MNYRLDNTPEGARWVQQRWNTETEKVEETPLEIGESISFSPDDFIGKSSVFAFKVRPTQIMAHNDGSHYTLEELFAELEEKYKDRKFEPCAFYNEIGDFLQIYWEEGPCVTEWLNNTVEIQRDAEDRNKIIGANVWGIKKILLEAYADCDKPQNMIGIPAKDPNLD